MEFIASLLCIIMLATILGLRGIKTAIEVQTAVIRAEAERQTTQDQSLLGWQKVNYHERAVAFPAVEAHRAVEAKKFLDDIFGPVQS